MGDDNWIAVWKKLTTLQRLVEYPGREVNFELVAKLEEENKKKTIKGKMWVDRKKADKFILNVSLDGGKTLKFVRNTYRPHWPYSALARVIIKKGWKIK